MILSYYSRADNCPYYLEITRNGITKRKLDLSDYALKSELFSGSWNDLTDKPFYVGESEVTTERELYLDTDLHGPVYESWEDDEGEVYEELIEDNNFDELKFIENCIGKVSYVTFDDKEYICDTTNEITSSSTNRETGFYRMLSRDGSFMIVVEYDFDNESYIFIRQADVYVNGEKLDKNDTDLEHHITIENEYEKIVTPIKTIDPKFIKLNWNDLIDRPFGVRATEEERVDTSIGDGRTITTDSEGNFENYYLCDEENDMWDYHFLPYEYEYPDEIIKGYVKIGDTTYEVYPSLSSVYLPLCTAEDSNVVIDICTALDAFNIYGLEPNTTYSIDFDYVIANEQIDTIDDKFISDNIIRWADVDNITESILQSISWKNLADKPFYEGEAKRHLIHENTISKDSNGVFVGKSPFYVTEGRVLVKLDGGNFYGEMTWWGDEYVFNDEGEELEVSIYRFTDEYDELYIEFEHNSKKLRSFSGMATEGYEDDHVFEFKLYSLDEPLMILNDECISDNIARISDIEDLISSHVVDWDTVSNKPFGEEPVVAEVLYENEVEANNGNINLVTLFSDNFYELFVLGGIYQFTLDTKKAIVKFTNENNGMGEGEFETIDGSFMIDGTDVTELLIQGIKDGAHYLKIERIEGTITKTIDEKYIPDSIPRLSDIENTVYDGILLKDEGNGNVYTLKMVNGTLVTSCDVESLELVTPPDKMEYAIGDEFDPTGMSIKATFAGGVENDVTNQIEYDAIREEDNGNYIIGFMNQTVSIPIRVALPDPFADDPAFSNFVYTWDGFENTATITDLKDYNVEELIIPDDERIILQVDA